LTFDDPECILYFAADGGFTPFDVTSPVDGVIVDFGEPARPEIDTVING